ncbi:hypothetical protein [Falsigemmobacter intermedius]|uniref:hypothetical protein n=1 Tax=Falsigemmobacter intermedius TaxID=1553448 RepID=UPI003F014F7B
MRASMFLVLLMASPADALDGAGFEASVTGQTLQWQSHGTPYGAEQYLPDRRVIWQSEGGACHYGTWTEPEPGRICFLYEHRDAPQCWHFQVAASGLSAQFLGLGQTRSLTEASRSAAPLNCPELGPGV